MADTEKVFNPEEEARLRRQMEGRRKELRDERGRLDESWRVLHEPYVEMQEMAQEEKMTQGYESLDTLEKDEIEQIDAALRKITAGSYGICESCGKFIEKKRLAAIPWTPLCADCAREKDLAREQGPARPPKVDLDKNIGLPPDFSGMSDPDIEAAVWDTLRTDGRVETDELEIRSQKGVLHLDGLLPSEEKHDLLLQIIQDNLGLENIVDQIRVEPIAWQRPDRTPNEPADEESGGRTDTRSEEEQILEGDTVQEDAYTSRTEGEPLSPSDQFIPEKEK